MDRNREARRASNMAAPPANGISRRRHRSNSLRDSPDEDGGTEVHEGGRIRERGVVKKDRLDRDRDRERERSSRSKRRRDNRMNMIQQHHNNNHNSHNHSNNNHVTGGSNRDEGDDTSDESVNDEDEDDDDGGDGLRMLPPLNPPSSHHNSSANNHVASLHHRKSFPPAVNSNSSNNNKVFRAAAPPAWKAADEMIGVSVPRKARSASTKRSHEWVSGVVGSGSVEQSHRQSSMSPVAASPAAPPSPSSSNVSVRKKMKSNGGGGGVSKPRPPKATPKSSSSNPEELEIEIAEVLYGLMTQSQAPAKKELPTNDAKLDSNKSASDVSNPPQNSTSLSTVAPKRKRPRQVSENNPFSVRSSPVSSSVKTENDHQNHQQSPKTDSSGSAAAVVGSVENGVSFGFTSLPGHPVSSTEVKVPVVEEAKMVLTKEEAEKQSPAVGLNDGKSNNEGLIATAASITTTTNLKPGNTENESQKEEKFEIDLMAPPPQQRTSPERDNGDIGFSDHKAQETSNNVKDKEDEKIRKFGKDETISLTEEQKSKAETGESLKKAMDEERNIELRIDLEKPNKDSASMVSGSSNRSLSQVLKHQQAKSEVQTEKPAQPSSIPMPIANWPPMGYVAPLQGVISMDGNTMPQAPIQPIFTQPRPKRCATHCYIARNIHYLQQFMKINPFWPPASGTAAMFGAKPSNLNVMPSAELQGNIAGGPLQAMQDKGPGLGIFPGHTAVKDNKSAQTTTVPDPAAQRKHQVMLQQTMPPVTPNNILHGPAFIFPFNQQQAVAASAASVRPGLSKLNTSTAGGLGGAAGSANSATVSSATTAAVPAMSFNYPNMGANETQYMAILQNNAFPYPIPAAVGGPPNFRGNPHAQAMPLFNGSFYSSQMIHPSQIPQTSQQQAAPSQSQNHHPSQAQQSSGSTSSSQKHLQAQQQRQQQGSGTAVNGSGNGNSGSLHNSFPGHKNRSQQPSQHMNPPPQARHLENEVTGGEDSPSTADSRVSRGASAMSVYGHNFAMPVHSQNFALMNAQPAISNAPSGNSNDKKQQQHQQQQSQQQGLKRGGVDSSSLQPQTFAMSFAPMNGPGTLSSMAQNQANHAMFQSLPESLRQTYHHMLAAPAGAASVHHSQQKKDFRISEEASRAAAGHDSSNADDDRKGSAGLTGKSGQSIAFSRPDLATDATNSSGSISGTSVVDSSSRNINLGANNRSSRSPIPTSVAAAQSSHHLHAQFQQQQQHQQQQILQLQKQQQQNINNARSKNPPSSNGSAYPEHHLMTSASSMAGKFPNSLSSFPLQTSNSSSSPAQSPQWRNSVRGPATSQGPSSLVPASTSSLKNLHQAHQSQQAHQPHQSQQQQSSRPHPHSQTQISFGAASQKLPSTTSSQMQQQNQNQNPGSNNSNQSPSPPMLVGSPTTSSLSKGGGGGAGGSPRTNPSVSTSGRPAQASSLSSSQQAKNSPVGTQRTSPSPSILGNPHMTTNSSSGKSQQQHQQQQQLPKQTLQQQQQQHLFFTNPYMQVQQSQGQQHSGGSATASGASGYYLPRKQQNQPQSQQQSQQNQQSSSTSMLSLCPPVTMANTTTSDPAKAIAAATSNLKGGSAQQGIMHAAQYSAAQSTNAGHQLLPGGFPQYVHNPPAAVQVKSAEQKQPAGNDNLRTWQPDKK